MPHTWDGPWVLMLSPAGKNTWHGHRPYACADAAPLSCSLGTAPRQVAGLESIYNGSRGQACKAKRAVVGLQHCPAGKGVGYKLRILQIDSPTQASEGQG